MAPISGLKPVLYLLLLTILASLLPTLTLAQPPPLPTVTTTQTITPCELLTHHVSTSMVTTIFTNGPEGFDPPNLSDDARKHREDEASVDTTYTAWDPYKPNGAIVVSVSPMPGWTNEYITITTATWTPRGDNPWAPGSNPGGPYVTAREEMEGMLAEVTPAPAVPTAAEMAARGVEATLESFTGPTYAHRYGDYLDGEPTPSTEAVTVTVFATPAPAVSMAAEMARAVEAMPEMFTRPAFAHRSGDLNVSASTQAENVTVSVTRACFVPTTFETVRTAEPVVVTVTVEGPPTVTVEERISAHTLQPAAAGAEYAGAAMRKVAERQSHYWHDSADSFPIHPPEKHAAAAADSPSLTKKSEPAVAVDEYAGAAARKVAERQSDYWRDDADDFPLSSHFAKEERDGEGDDVAKRSMDDVCCRMNGKGDRIVQCWFSKTATPVLWHCEN